MAWQGTSWHIAGDVLVLNSATICNRCYEQQRLTAPGNAAYHPVH
jgi:hypothetical protein